MGWFDSPKPQEPADEILPLSQERLIEIFDKEGWVYNIDDDGDLGGRWGDGIFYFLVHGSKNEIFQVMGRWMRPVPEDRLEELKVFIEDWHREHFWPKCFHVVDKDGLVKVNSEFEIDLEFGASTKQLAQHVHCALGTSMQFFNAVSEHFGLPELSD